MILVFGQLIIRTKDVPWPREQSRTARIMLLCMLEKLDILGPKIGVATRSHQRGQVSGTSPNIFSLVLYFLGQLLFYREIMFHKNHTGPYLNVRYEIFSSKYMREVLFILQPQKDTGVQDIILKSSRLMESINVIYL